MCVTNTTTRRPQPSSTSNPQVSFSQSLLSQRLFAGYVSTVPPKQPITSQSAYHFPSELVSSIDTQEKTLCQEKLPPKRRRKPQKPGLTAKNHERHFVVHNYHDHALDDGEGEGEEIEIDGSDEANHRRRGGVSIAFPLKLHSVLDQVELDGLSHVISWQEHGRAFAIHDPKVFVDHVMPKYFRQSKLTSFQRQLNLYGFNRLTRGHDAGAYYHERFLRGKEFLCNQMTRTKVKGTRFKAASSPEQEPDFYQMPPVVVSPHTSDEEQSNSYDYEPIEATIGKPASCQSYESQPLPFAQMPRMDIPPLYYSQSFPAVLPISFHAAYSDADKILDEAVDELFLHQGEVDSLSEFVHDWDPSFDQSSCMGPTIEDDTQLGYLLEKLLNTEELSVL